MGQEQELEFLDEFRASLLDVDEGNDLVNLSWSFSKPLTYNYSGFMITRTAFLEDAVPVPLYTDTLAFIQKGYPLQFMDMTGQPGVAYVWSLEMELD